MGSLGYSVSGVAIHHHGILQSNKITGKLIPLGKSLCEEIAIFECDES